MTVSERSEASSAVWWGNHSLDEGQVLTCRIGPLRLSVQRLAQEWRVAHRRETDSPESSFETGTELGEVALEDPHAVDRFLERQTTATCSLMPVLADRPVVSRPEMALRVLPGESATLFLSSPVWVRVAEGEGRGTLTELPASIASDTWFGPSTREGELRYASRTHGRLELRDLPLRPHRAVTPVTIDNRGEGHLLLERIGLPTPHLSVFSGPRGFLWTEAVTLVREEDGQLARLHVHPGASESAPDGRLLSEPRLDRPEGGIFRAFGTFFG